MCAARCLQTCTAEFFVPLMAAGVDTGALEGLASCDFSAASVPDCLVEQISTLPVTGAAEEKPAVTASQVSRCIFCC